MMLLNKELSPVNFITIAPDLCKNDLRLFHYKALETMAKANLWNPITVLPEKSNIESIPNTWKKCLRFPSKWRKTTFFAKIFPCFFNFFNLFLLLYSFKRTLLKHTSKDVEAILYIESINLFMLFALYWSLIITKRKRINIWLYYNSEKSCINKKKEKLFLKRIKKRIGNKRLSLFTNNDYLQKKLHSLFEQRVFSLPILSEITPSSIKNDFDSKKITLLLPSKSPDDAMMNYLFSLSNPTDLKFFLRTTFDKELPNKEICLLPFQLPDSFNSYLKALKDCQILLLPKTLKNKLFYRSHMFVHSILLGGIPLVSPKTWEGSELKKHNLDELIIDFDTPYLFSNITNIFRSESVLDKIEKIQKVYHKTHNLEQFSYRLKYPKS